MKKVRLAFMSGVLVVASLYSTSTFAVDELTVNGVTYQCQNQCRINATLPNGGWKVEDKYGGWSRVKGSVSGGGNSSIK